MTAQLFARGQAAEAHGDISGARRLYKVAAEQKHQGAALALAQLYDPDYLRRTTIGGIAPDPAAARYWYQQAEALAAIPPGPRPATVSER
jgi:TPR repeat protein